MTVRHYGLPSLPMLASFEAAARNGSFKAAAEELGVTAGAVSHQIKGLELELGLALFDRHHRAVELTEEGRVLFEATARGFMGISRAVSGLTSDNDKSSVSIGATTAVSSLWLTPRLTRFWREYGEITISQEVRDRPFQRPISLDFVIEYALERPKDAAELLFGDELLPLCAPSFTEQFETPELLAQGPLIHLDARETNWTSWEKWFAEFGYHRTIAAPHRVNNYSIALQLAQDGTGIVLGWRRLVQPLLEDGRLVPITEFSRVAPGAFYLVQNNQTMNAESELVKNWLIQNIE